MRDITFDRLNADELNAQFEKINRANPGQNAAATPVFSPRLEMCTRCNLRSYQVTRDRDPKDTHCGFCKSAEKAGLKPFLAPSDGSEPVGRVLPWLSLDGSGPNQK